MKNLKENKIKMAFIFLLAIVAYKIILAVFFTDPTTNTKDESVNSPLTAQLETASSIEVRKVYFHPNRKYNVWVNGELVGYITRNNTIFRGKTFKLRDLNGNVIRSEKENKRIFTFNRSATFYDLGGYETIKIKENKMKNILEFNPEYRFSIYDSLGTKIGYTKATFLSFIKNKHEILDNHKIALYKIEKNKIFPKRYTITTVLKNSKISVLDATLYTAVNDSIISSKSSNSRSSRSSRSSK